MRVPPLADKYIQLNYISTQFSQPHNGTVQRYSFNQPGVKERAIALIIYNCWRIEVIKENHEKAVVPAHLIDVSGMKSIEELERGLSFVFIQLSQLSDHNYKVTAHARGLGRGVSSSSLTLSHKLTEEEHKQLKPFLKTHHVQIDEKGYLRALSERDISVIRLFIKVGIGPNIPYSEDSSVKTLKQFVTGDPIDREIAQLLIEEGADLKVLEDTNRTSLVDAMEKKDEQLAIALINAGIDLNRKTTFDEPVLHIAISKKLKQTAMALIKKGINTTIANSAGQSPLAYLVHSRESWGIFEFKELLNALLIAGAKTNDKDPSSINDVITILKDT